jgi:ribosomal protein L22
MAVAVTERETVKAQARYVRCSARKARLVLEHIRGKQAAEATAILAFATRAAAKDAGKVLASAIANAENNNGYDADDLAGLGIGFSLFDMPALAVLSARIVAEEQALRRPVAVMIKRTSTPLMTRMTLMNNVVRTVITQHEMSYGAVATL